MPQRASSSPAVAAQNGVAERARAVGDDEKVDEVQGEGEVENELGAGDESNEGNHTVESAGQLVFL